MYQAATLCHYTYAPGAYRTGAHCKGCTTMATKPPTTKPAAAPVVTAPVLPVPAAPAGVYQPAATYVAGVYRPSKPLRKAAWQAVLSCLAANGGKATGSQLHAALAAVPGMAAPAAMLNYLTCKAPKAPVAPLVCSKLAPAAAPQPTAAQ